MYLTDIDVLFCQNEGLTPEDAVLVIQRYYRSWRHGEKPPSNQKHRRKSSRAAPRHQQSVNKAPDRQGERISFSHNVSYNSLCHWNTEKTHYEKSFMSLGGFSPVVFTISQE